MAERGIDALGYMLTEEGRIVAIRNKQIKHQSHIKYDELNSGRRTLLMVPKDLMHEGWELGWDCVTCRGNGVMADPCPCASHHINSGACCDGTVETKCPDCEDGIRWEEKY